MTRLSKPQIRIARSISPRQQSVRQAILRQHLAGGAKKVNVGKSVGSFVPKLAQKAFEKYGFSTVALLTDWAVIVGQDMARYTRPEKLKWPRMVAVSGDVEAGCEGRPGATLMLRVEPARALDVEYGAAQIVERINSYFGYRAVVDIRILQIPLEVRGRANAVASAPMRPAAPAIKAVGQAGEGVADEVLAAVPDENLRNSLQRLQAGLRQSQR